MVPMVVGSRPIIHTKEECPGRGAFTEGIKNALSRGGPRAGGQAHPAYRRNIGDPASQGGEPESSQPAPGARQKKRPTASVLPRAKGVR
eukprot:6043026-Heterocapsa_arctica.AAC.1